MLPGFFGILPRNLPAQPWHVLFRRVSHSTLLRIVFLVFVHKTSAFLLSGKLPGTGATVMSTLIQFAGCLLFSFGKFPGKLPGNFWELPGTLKK